MKKNENNIPNFLVQLASKAEGLSNQELENTKDINYYRRLAVFFLYVKSVKTFSSLVILSKNGRDEDSRILMRSLLENQITSYWLQLKGDYSVLLFWRYELVSKLKQHDNSRQVTLNKRNPEEFDYLRYQAEIEHFLKDINDKLKEIDKTFNPIDQENLDKRGMWAGINIQTMAKEISTIVNNPDMKWKYDIPYNETSWYVHPNPVVMNDYFLIDDSIIKPDFSSDKEKLFAITILASECIIDLMKNFNNIFNLGKEADISKIEKQCFEIFKKEE